MLGANGTLFLVMVALAFGFSSLAPSEGLLRALRVVGGGFLIYLAVDELRRVRREAADPKPAVVETAADDGPDVARRRVRGAEPGRLDLLRDDRLSCDRGRDGRRPGEMPRWRRRSS